jgi:hypothetical protein
MLNVLRNRVVSKVLVAVICVGLGASEVASAQNSGVSTEAQTGVSGISYQSGASFLSMHTLLTAVGNAYDRNAFTADETRLYANQVVEAMGDAVKGVEALRQLGVPSYMVDELIGAFKLLGESAQALIRYTESGSASDREAFLASRDGAWTKLTVLVGRPDRKPAV